MDIVDILSRLVAFPSVVGLPNHAITDWIRAYAEEHGAVVTTLPGPEGDRSNLFVSVGPAERHGYVLSGHMDVVPAAEAGWLGDPFTLRREGDRLYGRGTSDMKGFLACALAALPDLGRRTLARPLHIALSYDEEDGCRGVPHLIAALPGLCAPPLGCIVGEPSGLVPVRGHKGKAAARIAVRGRSGHSSRPDRGLNAIHAMTEVLTAAAGVAASCTAGPLDARFEPPHSTVQVGRISGGEAVNVIPDLCTIEIEARAIAGVDPGALLASLEEVLATLRQRGFATEWEAMSAYPALALGADAPLAILVERLSGHRPLDAVSYGTEAGLFQAAGIDAIICGPGDIVRAHRPNEYIERRELEACQRLIEGLIVTLSEDAAA